MIKFLHQLQTRFRLTLSESVLLRLIPGLLVSVACLFGFAALAEDVIEGDPIVRFDRALDDALHASTSLQVAKIFEFISLFGSQVVLIITLIVAIYYLYKRRWIQLGIWLIAIAGGEILNLILKTLIDRPRPFYADPFVQEIYSSFPSGHAMLSVILYGMLAYFVALALQNQRLRILVVFLAVLMSVLIGISRLYLGVHYLSDVIAGYLAGGISLATSYRVKNHDVENTGKVFSSTLDTSNSVRCPCVLVCALSYIFVSSRSIHCPLPN
ncbi:MAG: phosphatase PAP2 family protein [Chloroflexi bacterium]|nr:phosphatase PAP2 family protein [Chloroflexota bacterium]